MTAYDPPALLTVLQHIHTYTWTLQSDDARRYAFEVAEAASRGLISTEVLPGQGVYGKVWKITIAGLVILTHGAHLIAAEELAAFRVHLEAGDNGLPL